VREEAIDRIMELAEQDAWKAGGSGGIAYTVVAPSGFFKDYERIFRCFCCCMPPAGSKLLGLRCTVVPAGKSAVCCGL
jgi:hypothetical protein